jgi:hypothetical protein
MYKAHVDVPQLRYRPGAHLGRIWLLHYVALQKSLLGCEYLCWSSLGPDLIVSMQNYETTETCPVESICVPHMPRDFNRHLGRTIIPLSVKA